MSISIKDALRFAIPIFIASICTDFLFHELGMKISGLIFTENFDLKIALAHGFSFLAVLCGVYWLLGKLAFFEKK